MTILALFRVGRFLPQATARGFFEQPRDQRFEFGGAQVFAFTGSNRYLAGFYLASPANDHVRHPFHRVLSNLKSDFLVPKVCNRSYSRLLQLPGHLLNVLGLLVGDAHDHRLNGRQPKGEKAGVFFDQNPNETFHRV